jgi:hypothetical protein
MEIDYLRRENPEKSRKTLDWLNPQADFKVRYKNKKRYYQNLAQLSNSKLIKEPTLLTLPKILT